MTEDLLDRLCQGLEEIGIVVDETFRSRARWNLSKVPSAADEIVSMVLVDCLSKGAKTSEEALRSVDTIRHRVARESKRFVSNTPEFHEHRQPKEQAIGLVEAIESLSSEDRTLFTLRYLEDHSVESLASMFKTPASTMYRKLAAIRKQIESQLG